MSFLEMAQVVANLGVAAVAAVALIYVHVKQIPALIQAMKSEGSENRKALQEEGEVNREAIHDIITNNNNALDKMANTFRETLAEDRCRCDERESRSQEARHDLADKVHIAVEHRAAVVAMMGEVKQLTETLRK